MGTYCTSDGIHCTEVRKLSQMNIVISDSLKLNGCLCVINCITMYLSVDLVQGIKYYFIAEEGMDAFSIQ